MITRSQARKIKMSEQQNSGNSQEEFEINNQMGMSELWESEEMSEQVDIQTGAEGPGVEKVGPAKEDEFQIKLIAMLSNMKEDMHSMKLAQEKTQQEVKILHETLNRNNQQLIEKFEKKVEVILKKNEKVLYEIREERKLDRSRINQINEKVEQSIQEMGEIRNNHEIIVNEVTKNSKVIADNSKKVKEVEGKVTKTQEDLQEKVRKMEEEKARKICELKEVQDAIRLRLNEVENRPVQQTIIGERAKDITFNGEEAYPMEFLKELDDVKALYNTGEGVKWVSRHLIGDARIWYRVNEHRITNYTQFKEAFTEKFWGAQVQEKIRDGLEYGRYHPAGELSMVQYAERRVLQCRQLIPPLTDQQIIRKLAKHYNPEVGVAVVTRGIKEIDQFETLLGEFKAMNSRAEYNNDNNRKGKFGRRWDEQRGPPEPADEDNDPPRHKYVNNKYEGNKKPAVKGEYPRKGNVKEISVINQQPGCSKNGTAS